MYIKVIFGKAPQGDSAVSDCEIPSEVLVNPDCPIRNIYDFLRKTFGVSNRYELDLCDESGNLILMYEKEQWMYGLNYFLPKTTYFVVLFEKDEDAAVTNPLLYLPEFIKKSSSQWNDFISKLRKQLNPSLNKPSRMLKTRSNSSHNKW